MKECTFSGFTFPSLPRAPRGRRRRAPRRPAPGRGGGRRSSSGGGRTRAPGLRRASALTSWPAPRAAASARLALRDSSPELSQSAGAPPFSPRDSASPRRFPPSPPLPTPPPPSPNSPASRRLSGVATPVFRAPGQRFSAHKTAARGSARLGAGRTIAAGGWGRGAPRPSAARRPPPARPRGPQGRSGYRLGSVTPSGAGCRRR